MLERQDVSQFTSYPMGLQRQDLSQELFGWSPQQALMAPRGSANDGARAGASAAAEAAAIAASLSGSGAQLGNGQNMRQQLALSPNGAVFANSEYPGTIPAEFMSFAPAMPNSMAPPRPQEALGSALADAISAHIDSSARLTLDHDFVGAPAPLPRLGETRPGGEMRLAAASAMTYAGNSFSDGLRGGEMRPTEATVAAAENALAAASAMAYAERNATASTGFSSCNPSWVAAPMGQALPTLLRPMGLGLPKPPVPPLNLLGGQAVAYENGFPQLLSPQSYEARVLSTRIANASPAPALLDPRAAEMSKLPPPPTSLGEACRPLVAERVATTSSFVQRFPSYGAGSLTNDAQGFLSVQRGRQQFVVPPERPLMPRRFNDEGQPHIASLAGSISMPQLPRTQSVPITPNSRTNLTDYRPASATGFVPVRQSISPFPARTVMASYPCPVWPPPPLPPVSGDLLGRLEALEIQKNQGVNNMREQHLEQLRSELERAQASASQCKNLELELETCNATWKLKFEALELRWVEDEAAAARSVEEAMRAAELRTLETTTRLRDELQAARAEGDLALEDGLSQGKREVEQLRHELQMARDAEQRSREEAERRNVQISQVRFDLDQQTDQNFQSAEQLLKLEQRARGMEEDLRNERASAMHRGTAVSEQQRTYQVEMTRISSEGDELRLRLNEVIQDREKADLEFQRLQRANSQKEEECKKLKNEIQVEKDHARLLQKELQTAKAEANNAAARAKLESDAVSIRRSISSTQNPVVRNSVSRAIDASWDVSKSLREASQQDANTSRTRNTTQASEIWSGGRVSGASTFLGEARVSSTQIFQSQTSQVAVPSQTFDVDLTGDDASEVVHTTMNTFTRTDNFQADARNVIEVDINDDSSAESEMWPR